MIFFTITSPRKIKNPDLNTLRDFKQSTIQSE